MNQEHDFDAYTEGREAFRNGQGESDNPYVIYAAMHQTFEYSSWQAGWYAAEADSRK